MIYKCGPNVLANKFKTQMINAHVQICNLIQIDVVMGRVDQSFEISEHITLKKKMVISKHSIHIPFIDLHSCFEVTNTSFSCANLIKEYIASNNAITIINFNKISTLVSKDILD